MTDSTLARVHAGVPAGGQFAAAARTEADVSLTGDGPAATHQRLADQLAVFMGADPRAVKTSTSSIGCGGMPGDTLVSAEADHAEHGRVGFSAELTADGAAKTIRVWAQAHPDPAMIGAGALASPVGVEFTDEARFVAKLDEAHVMARHQKTLDETINFPQQLKRAERGHPTYEILEARVVSGGQSPKVLLEDHCGHAEPLTFTVDEATGRAVQATVSTRYGAFTLTGANLARAGREGHRAIAIALENFDEVAGDSAGWDERLNARFAALFGAR